MGSVAYMASEQLRAQEGRRWPKADGWEDPWWGPPKPIFVHLQAIARRWRYPRRRRSLHRAAHCLVQ
jgi:hypothetical protein